MSAFDVTKLPSIGELVIARMLGARNEPFGLGVVVAAPTLLSSPCAVRAAAQHAGAAASAAPVRLTAAQLDDVPLSQLATLSFASFEVQVHWYDLESDWVARMRLLDDKHWETLYQRHKAADERAASRAGRQPLSAAWIVARYQCATFLPKPGEADEVQGTLAVAALIVWGSRDKMLTATGRLTPAAFDAVWRDLVETPRDRQQVSIAAAAAADDDDASSDGESTAVNHCRKKRSASTAAAATLLPAETKRARAAPSSAPSKLKTAGSAAAAAAGAGAGAAAAAAISNEQCGSCQRLQGELSEMAQDLEAVRRLITALAAKFNTSR
jgi:hypothetical protein